MASILNRVTSRAGGAVAVVITSSVPSRIARRPSNLPSSSSPTTQLLRASRTFSDVSLFEDIRPGQRVVIDPSSSNKRGKGKKSKITPKKAPPFIDRIHLRARGGMGGAGCLSHAKLGSYKQKPNGGHGGKGGSVYLVTDPNMSSLKMEKHHYAGHDGGRGGKNGMRGRDGKDVYVRVPCGVVVKKVLDSEDDHDEGDEYWEEDDGLENFGEIEVEGLDDEDNSLEGGGKQLGSLASSDAIGDEHLEDDEESDHEEHENSNGDEEFDAYYRELIASKRQRKRNRRRRKLPTDYDEIVGQGIRADDGMYYWGTAGTENNEDDDTLVSSSSEPYSTSPQKRKTVFLADLDQPHTSFLVAAGGKSGVGNQVYANRPYFANRDANAAQKAIPGEGEIAHLELELKLIADVGLVGFPNAGKSSLLSAMSRARPKIASYPFTTLHPLVGTIQYRDGFRIVMADVPGLIDGAATEGRGRGIEFLRHIERTKALVYMVDAAGVDGRSPVDDLRVLGKELREYGSSGLVDEEELEGDNESFNEEHEYNEEMMRRRREIMKRPSLILANKMDLIPQNEVGLGRREELLFQLAETAQEVGISCPQENILGISAGVSGEGLRVLSKQLRRIVGEAGH